VGFDDAACAEAARATMAPLVVRKTPILDVVCEMLTSTSFVQRPPHAVFAHKTRSG
jgi:hypothetical protein